ncbi:MAG: hypothetical protein QXY90_04950 [Candidatus Anstonellales archaeon]
MIAKSMRRTEIEIRDYMYEDVRLSDLEREIVDTEEFQKLRRRNQLPITQYVYPTATHTRFSHSIGTMNVATRIFDNIPEIQDRMKKGDDKTEWLRRCTRITALLYDITDPPFYQVFNEDMENREIIGKVLKETRLETIKKMFDSLKNAKEYDVSFEDISDILENDNTPNKFIRQIIDSEVGANRIDYLFRDSHFCGIHYGKIDSRILNMFKLRGDSELVLSREAIPLADNIFHALFSMRYNVYDHKVSRIITRMFYETYKTMLKTKRKRREDMIRELATFDDREFIEALEKFEENNKWVKDYVGRVYRRRDLLKTAYVLEAAAIKDIRLVPDLDNLREKRDDLEKDIKKHYDVNVLLDFAPITTPRTTNLNVEIDDQAVPLSSSPLLCEWYSQEGVLGLGDKALTQWKMIVISEKEEQQKATDVSTKLFVPFLIGKKKIPDVKIASIQQLYNKVKDINYERTIDEYRFKIISLSNAKRERLLKIYEINKPITSKDLAKHTKKSVSIENTYLENLYTGRLLERERAGHSYQYVPTLEVRKALEQLKLGASHI